LLEGSWSYGARACVRTVSDTTIVIITVITIKPSNRAGSVKISSSDGLMSYDVSASAGLVAPDEKIFRCSDDVVWRGLGRFSILFRADLSAGLQQRGR
jgi:hypothetical protein